MTNVWRHYQLQHSTEDEVQQILTSEQTGKNCAINKLRMLGDYFHNVQVLSQKSGQLIVVRRPSANTASFNDFLPCVGCKGFFLRKELWRHCKNCDLRKTSLQQPEKACQKEGLMLISPVLYTAAKVDPALAAVLATMTSDHVSLVAKNDCIILTFGSLLAQNCTANQYGYVSQRMRQLARLLIELRNRTEAPDADLSSFLKPHMFDTVVAGALKVSEYVECTRTEPPKLKVPSLALKVGYALRRCCTVLLNKALREKNAVLERDAESFIRIYDSEWQTRVSSIALKTLTSEKRNKPDLIPLTADLVKLKAYLESAITELSGHLYAEATAENYVNLVECTVSRIILFNKRRGGEVARMTVKQYEKLSDPTAGTTSGLDDISKTLSQTEQQLCTRLKLVEIAGKRNQTVPVLLTPDVIKGIDSVLANRAAVGINASNLFVFARCSGLSSVDPFAALRRVAECASTERPELVRSTKLRKYVATVSQVLDMKSSELSLLCRHMGHSIHVHEDFYRLPSHTLELAKVSKLLIAVEGGDLTQLSGKTLNNLDIDDIPDAYLQQDESNDETSDDTDASRQSLSKQTSTVSDRNKDVDDSDILDDVEDSGDSDTGISVHKQNKKRKKAGGSQVIRLPRPCARKCVKNPWSAAEKSALFEHFADNIRSRTVPAKKECEEALRKYPVFKYAREWRHIKFAVKNLISSEKKLAV